MDCLLSWLYLNNIKYACNSPIVSLPEAPCLWLATSKLYMGVTGEIEVLDCVDFVNAKILTNKFVLITLITLLLMLMLI